MAAMVAAIGGELIATGLWWRPYFAHGVLVFRSQVPLAPGAGGMPTADALESGLGKGLGGSLMFRAVSESEVAFREPLNRPGNSGGSNP